jgi:hypothetical protein
MLIVDHDGFLPDADEVYVNWSVQAEILLLVNSAGYVEGKGEGWTTITTGNSDADYAIFEWPNWYVISGKINPQPDCTLDVSVEWGSKTENCTLYVYYNFTPVAAASCDDKMLPMTKSGDRLPPSKVTFPNITGNLLLEQKAGTNNRLDWYYDFTVVTIGDQAQNLLNNSPINCPCTTNYIWEDPELQEEMVERDDKRTERLEFAKSYPLLLQPD